MEFDTNIVFFPALVGARILHKDWLNFIKLIYNFIYTRFMTWLEYMGLKENRFLSFQLDIRFCLFL